MMLSNAIGGGILLVSVIICVFGIQLLGSVSVLLKAIENHPDGMMKAFDKYSKEREHEYRANRPFTNVSSTLANVGS